MEPPAILAAAINALPQDPRFELTGGWVDRGNGNWSFRFRARLSEAPTAYVKEWTAWHLVTTDNLSDPDIHIYPDAVEGIDTTFPHQDYNSEPKDGLPWRTGKPCLERPMAVFRRNAWGGEPFPLEERLVWHIGRLLVWIDAAAAGRLIEPGDPIELPVYPAADATTVLGFRETLEDLNWWQHHDESWGFATLSKIPGARGTAVIADFMDPMRRSIRRIPWSNAIPLEEGRVDAVWMLLPGLIMFEPWRAATTWQELTQLVGNTAIDLPSILADAGARLRRIQRPKDARPVHLLIGFPLEERMAGEHQRFHWVAISNMQLCQREDIRKGYSDLAGARRAWDRELAKSPRRLEWRRTANWATDQLRKRGEAEEAVRSKSVLVLGVGTLGAAIAENLLRMGVTRMGLLDDDTMLVANLSRHLLTMADAGQGKAKRMADRLNMAAPDAQVVALPFAFPPTKPADAARLEGWDVVIDCTASDHVLRAMGEFSWVTERLFVSLSMTWQAKGLFAYAASETGFPAIDARERFAAASPPPGQEQVGEMEGIGCWHPVFPATADDVSLWAAIGSKFIRRAVVDRRKTAALFVLGDDGGVERKDA